MAPPSTDSTLARQLGVILGSSFFPDPYIHSTSNTHQFALSQTSRFFSTYLQSHHLFTSILHWDDLKGLLTDWFYDLSSPVYSPRCSQSNCLTQRLMLTRLSIRSRCHHGPQGPVRSGHCWLSINCSFPSLNCGHPAFVSDKHPTPSCLQDLHTSCFLCLEHHPQPLLLHVSVQHHHFWESFLSKVSPHLIFSLWASYLFP